ENAVKVFPTPARDVVHLILPGAVVNKEGVVSIHSLDGRLLQSTRLSGATSMRLNVSKLPAGVYTLRITSKTQMINKVITIAK
ncbi:MAG TPA: T9SS type A sorting domain-containing protein, partial [Flavisolibacter sp.]|nr:T9SS type A sorting domain-containing protein [Flavisolibacter sp.]